MNENQKILVGRGALKGVGKKVRNNYLAGQISEEEVLALYRCHCNINSLDDCLAFSMTRGGIVASRV